MGPEDRDAEGEAQREGHPNAKHQRIRIRSRSQAPARDTNVSKALQVLCFPCIHTFPHELVYLCAVLLSVYWFGPLSGRHFSIFLRGRDQTYLPDTLFTRRFCRIANLLRYVSGPANFQQWSPIIASHPGRGRGKKTLAPERCNIYVL